MAKQIVDKNGRPYKWDKDDIPTQAQARRKYSPEFNKRFDERLAQLRALRNKKQPNF